MESREYRKEYEKLGEERVQEKPAGRDTFPPFQVAQRRRTKRSDAAVQEFSEYELFWMFRKDLRWLMVPGLYRCVKIRLIWPCVANMLLCAASPL